MERCLLSDSAVPVEEQMYLSLLSLPLQGWRAYTALLGDQFTGAFPNPSHGKNKQVSCSHQNGWHELNLRILHNSDERMKLAQLPWQIGQGWQLPTRQQHQRAGVAIFSISTATSAYLWRLGLKATGITPKTCLEANAAHTTCSSGLLCPTQQ